MATARNRSSRAEIVGPSARSTDQGGLSLGTSTKTPLSSGSGTVARSTFGVIAATPEPGVLDRVASAAKAAMSGQGALGEREGGAKADPSRRRRAAQGVSRRAGDGEDPEVDGNPEELTDADERVAPYQLIFTILSIFYLMLAVLIIICAWIIPNNSVGAGVCFTIVGVIVLLGAALQLAYRKLLVRTACGACPLSLNL